MLCFSPDSANCLALNVSSIASASPLLPPLGSEPALDNEPCMAAGERCPDTNKCNWPKLQRFLKERGQAVSRRSLWKYEVRLEGHAGGAGCHSVGVVQAEVISEIFPRPGSRLGPRAGSSLTIRTLEPLQRAVMEAWRESDVLLN